jgi:hypothetical protein
MGLTSLIFRDTLKVNADYGTVVTCFKSGLDENFHKGYIDKNETQLFYFSGFFRRPLSVNLPIIQINFENKNGDQGQTIIKFKIVDFALIVFGLANGSILLFSIFDLIPNRHEQIPTGVPIVTCIFSYGFLLFVYLIELSGFKREIKRLQ